MKIVLASTSPRRVEIFRLLNIPFQTVAPSFEEDLSLPLPPETMAKFFAEEKAKSVAAQFPDHIIIAGDIVIACEGDVIGKPQDKKDAKRILKKLSGKQHQIFSAAIVLPPRANGVSVLEIITVTMRAFSDQEIDDYLKMEEYKDKAGAYSLQDAGSRLLASMSGDYFAAMGLPLKAILRKWPV